MPLLDMHDDLPEARGVGQPRWQETSAVMGLRGPQDPLQRRWYRDLHIPTWVWVGADAVAVQAVLARLAMASSARTVAAWLDTATGQGAGNWIYEWNQEGARCQQRGRQLLEQGEQSGARAALLRAANYYTIASYPHLRGDNFAHEAMLLANSCYREAGKLFAGPLHHLSCRHANHDFSLYLHLPPEQQQPVPLVVVCGGGDQLQTGFYRLFLSGLAAAGVAMATIDLPGVGACEHWSLDENYDQLLRAALQQLAALDTINSQRIALLGLRLGGSAALRTLLTEPDALRACAVIGTPVHQLFSDQALVDSLSPMVRDQLASRLRADALQMGALRQHLQPMSLIGQGLLGRRRTTVPLRIIAGDADPLTSRDELKRSQMASQQAELALIPGPLSGRLEQAMILARDFLLQQLS